MVQQTQPLFSWMICSLVSLHQDLVVDVLLAELVLDHGDLLAVRLGQHALEQRGLARAEEAGEDGGGDQAHVDTWQGLRGRAEAWQLGGMGRRLPFKVADLSSAGALAVSFPRRRSNSDTPPCPTPMSEPSCRSRLARAPTRRTPVRAPGRKFDSSPGPDSRDELIETLADAERQRADRARVAR